MKRTRTRVVFLFSIILIVVRHASAVPVQPSAPVAGWLYDETYLVDGVNNFGATVNASCGNGGYANNGIMYLKSKTKFKHITDGTSKTFLIGEMSWDIYGTRVWICGTNSTASSYAGYNIRWPLNSAPWCDPSYQNIITVKNDVSFGSLHPGGCHFGMADGSCQFIAEAVDKTVLWAGATRAFGEVVQFE